MRIYELITTVKPGTETTWERTLPDDGHVLTVTLEPVNGEDSPWVKATGNWMSLVVWLALTQGADENAVKDVMRPASHGGYVVAVRETDPAD